MQKISGIIAASPRVTSTDLSTAKALRPGVPSFGSPIGSSSLAGASRLPASAVDRVRQLQEEQIREAQAKEQSHVEIVDRMADSFFMRQRKDADPQVGTPSGEIDDLAEVSSVRSDEVEVASGVEAMDSDGIVKGGYLDIVA